MIQSPGYSFQVSHLTGSSSISFSTYTKRSYKNSHLNNSISCEKNKFTPGRFRLCIVSCVGIYFKCSNGKFKVDLNMFMGYHQIRFLDFTRNQYLICFQYCQTLQLFSTGKVSGIRDGCLMGSSLRAFGQEWWGECFSTPEFLASYQQLLRSCGQLYIGFSRSTVFVRYIYHGCTG